MNYIIILRSGPNLYVSDETADVVKNTLLSGLSTPGFIEIAGNVVEIGDIRGVYLLEVYQMMIGKEKTKVEDEEEQLGKDETA